MGKEATDLVRVTDEERPSLQPLVVGPRVARDKALRARRRRALPRAMSGCRLCIACASGGRGRGRGGPAPPTAGPSPATQTGRGARSASRGPGMQPDAAGARVLDPAMARGDAGGTGRRGRSRSGHGAANAQQNARKPWRKAPWVLPPEAHAACASDEPACIALLQSLQSSF